MIKNALLLSSVITSLWTEELKTHAGPKSRATHWKQTVLYLEDVLTICQGESIVGSMTVAPNKKNPRDVDISVKYSLNGRRSRISRTQYYRMRWHVVSPECCLCSAPFLHFYCKCTLWCSFEELTIYIYIFFLIF